MPDAIAQPDVLTVYLTILMLALIVFAMRATGAFGAFLIGGGATVQRVINTLPGCALAAIVAPAALRGSAGDVAAVIVTFALFMWTGRTILCLLLGIAISLISGHWQAGSFQNF